MSFKVESRSLGSICRDHKGKGPEDPAASLAEWLASMQDDGWEFVAVVSDTLYVFRASAKKTK